MERTPISPCSVRTAIQMLSCQTALAVVAPNSTYGQGMGLKKPRETLTVNAHASVDKPGNSGQCDGDFIMIPECNAKRTSRLEGQRSSDFNSPVGRLEPMQR